MFKKIMLLSLLLIGLLISGCWFEKVEPAVEEVPEIEKILEQEIEEIE